MKKLLIMILCVITVISLAACNKTSTNDGMKTAGGPPEGAAELTSEAYIGKVTAVTGNEVTIDLAELPEDEDAVNASGDAADGDDGPDSVAAAPVVPLIGQGGPASQGPKIELKYTGESKSAVIPAGATIFDIQTGKEVKMTSIKKGSVVEMFYTQSGVVTFVNIME